MVVCLAYQQLPMSCTTEHGVESKWEQCDTFIYVTVLIKKCDTVECQYSRCRICPNRTNDQSSIIHKWVSSEKSSYSKQFSYAQNYFQQLKTRHIYSKLDGNSLDTNLMLHSYHTRGLTLYRFLLVQVPNMKFNQNLLGNLRD